MTGIREKRMDEIYIYLYIHRYIDISDIYNLNLQNFLMIWLWG